MQDVFHVTLHRLRRALGAPEWVLFRAETYGLNRQLPFWSDVEEFQNLLQGAQDLERVAPAEAAERYRRAVALYQGDFLADTTAEWALPFQRKLAHAFEDALRRLAHLYLDRQDLASAVGCYQRLLERDYYREDIHRELLTAYALQGQPGMAHEHYRKFQRRLRLELDVEPEAATRELHHSIRIGRVLHLPFLVTSVEPVAGPPPPRNVTAASRLPPLLSYTRPLASAPARFARRGAAREPPRDDCAPRADDCRTWG